MSDRTPTNAEADERIVLVEAVFAEHPSMAIATSAGDEPWAGKVFFVDDEPEPGRLDLCCALIVTSRKLEILQKNPRIAFVVAGDLPDRWIQGVGRAEVVEDEADCDAIMKRLEEKSAPAGPFLRRVPWKGVRIHVERLKLTDVAAIPPVAEFTFA